MKAQIATFLLLATAACSGSGNNEATLSNDGDALANMARDPAALPNPPAASSNTSSAAPAPTMAWIGRWVGPEGLFLDIMPTDDPARFQLTLKDNLDSQAEYDARLGDGALHFTRAGKEETIRPGTGKQTGFSDLFDKSNCLIVVPGKEGYCRTDGTPDALPLTRGTYVMASEDCASPALAALRTFDGRGLPGAHTHDCKAKIVSQDGLIFALDNDCIDAGVGEAPRSTERVTITVKDQQHFTFDGENGSALAMKYCPFDQLPPSLRRRG